MPFISPKINRNQMMMTDFDSLIDPHSTARIIDYFIDNVDLEVMGFTNTTAKDEGRPCYPASSYMKLYLYGYRNDIRSSRKLEAACKVNIEVMWLMQGLTPDFRSISDFRKDNIRCMKKLFHEFTKRVTADVKTGAVSIDGSKFKAWNSKDRNFTITKLDDRIKWLEDHTEEYLRLIEIADENEEVNERSFTKEELDEKLREAQERLERYRGYRDLMEKENLSQLSLTDPDCRLMKDKNGTNTAYNVQAAVDTETHLLLDYQTTNQVTDHGLIASTLEGVKQQKSDDILHSIADKGYQQPDDLIKCLEKGIVPNVVLPDGRDAYELELDYEETEHDISSTDPKELKKSLHAGDIPQVYQGIIEKAEILEVRHLVKDGEGKSIESPYGTTEEMISRAKEGYFVRDPEADKVYCPAGATLRKKCIKSNGNTRYANKAACKKCPYRNRCVSASAQWKEIDFNKDTLEKPARWWNPNGPDGGDKAPKLKGTIGHYEKKKIVRITFRPDRQLMDLRKCTSEHPFGTMKRWHHSGYFLLKWKWKVDGEFALIGTGYNLSRAENMFTFDELMKKVAQKAS